NRVDEQALSDTNCALQDKMFAPVSPLPSVAEPENRGGTTSFQEGTVGEDWAVHAGLRSSNGNSPRSLVGDGRQGESQPALLERRSGRSPVSLNLDVMPPGLPAY